MTFLEKVMQIDRRWIYLAIGLAVIIPTIKTFHVPVSVSPEVRKVYDFVDEMKAGEYLFVCVDYDPSSMAELNPMAIAIINQAFTKDLKLILILSCNLPWHLSRPK